MPKTTRKFGIAVRVRELREDLYGEDGLENLAAALGVPAQTWRNYESGVTMPAEVLLEFLTLTGTDPNWLLTGEGERLLYETSPSRMDMKRPLGRPKQVTLNHQLEGENLLSAHSPETPAR